MHRLSAVDRWPYATAIPKKRHFQWQKVRMHIIYFSNSHTVSPLHFLTILSIPTQLSLYLNYEHIHCVFSELGLKTTYFAAHKWSYWNSEKKYSVFMWHQNKPNLLFASHCTSCCFLQFIFFHVMILLANQICFSLPTARLVAFYSSFFSMSWYYLLIIHISHLVSLLMNV